MKYKIISIVIVSSYIFFSSCKKDEQDDGHGDHTHSPEFSNQAYMDARDCTGVTTPTFNNDVSLIMNTSCATSGCHNIGTGASGIVLNNYSNTKSAFESHDFLCAINHGDGCSNMPKNSPKLHDTLIEKITCWAKSGFPQ
jgi:hypothetical protein